MNTTCLNSLGAVNLRIARKKMNWQEQELGERRERISMVQMLVLR